MTVVTQVAARLSLRQPQRDSLDRLDRICELIRLDKSQDLVAALGAIAREYPQIEDFEREFPSLCFALATGVGKTRLMGAFIAYLRLAKGIRHFFVLAPNLTIYDKLIRDFTPNTPKYVLQGIAEFALHPPEIVTGDNYESGRGVRGLFGAESVHINVFNISKINSEVRGGKSPRIKRLSEYIGQSYFDYLAGLDDLVLLMDESHRYRASAGIRAINELRPVLGLELTATPYVEAAGKAGTGQPFKNVLYSYPLGQAMADGFVKEPAVATRENFNPQAYTPDELEKLKLEDGVRVHEDVKVSLETYARQNDLARVKPFMLVVARDTTHANALLATIESDAFFGGRYRGKAITVHSLQGATEKDETVQRLLQVESADEPTEIVVHVNMLKEGWDVTNLYTIVPLRAATSRQLVEQSIGRGLRLPYGRRTGVPAVDRLTIVAHDRFQEIVDEANKLDSPLRIGVVTIGKDVAAEQRRIQTVEPTYMANIQPNGSAVVQSTMALSTPADLRIARATLDLITTQEYLPRVAHLQNPDVRDRMVRELKASYNAAPQPELAGLVVQPNFEAIVDQTTAQFIAGTIEIPRIVVQPTGDVSSGFHDFDLDTSGIHYQPIERDILIQHLRTQDRERLSGGESNASEARPEDYLVRWLIDFNDLHYDTHADLLYKLAGQVVARLRGYLQSEDDIANALQFHGRQIATLIHTQMQPHHWEHATAYEVTITRGFQTLKPATFATAATETARDFRASVSDPLYIRGMLFNGFKRCLYPLQRFQSDTERKVAVVLENDTDPALKWFKPAPGQFRIYYVGDQQYEPDFVVETSKAKYILEPKRASEMTDPDVQAKARAAAKWCDNASAHEAEHGGKPWTYVLIPHDQIMPTSTLGGLVGTWAIRAG